MGLTYCCCTASNSLCQACFGSTAPGTTGRKRSVLLLALAIVMALWMQYYLAPAIVLKEGMLWTLYNLIPGSSQLTHAWTDDCVAYQHNERLYVQCAGYTGVYRVMAVSTLFFAIFAVAARLRPSLNRDAWPAKYVIFILINVVTIVMPSGPLFSGVFLFIARLGAAAFIVLQQIILIDV